MTKARAEAAYRFLRRYLKKYHPDIALRTNLEGYTTEEIQKKEEELVNWKG